MKRAIAILLFAAMPAAAQFAPGLPPGKWWRRPEVAQRLELTAEQQQRFDAISQSAALELIDLKSNLEKRTLELRNQLDREQPDRTAARAAAAKVSEARAKIFEREVELLLEMRASLSAEQWTKLRASLERAREAASRRRGQHRPPNRGQR
jgi:Spy/CpxP family protein refolding chaperone